MKVSVDSIGCRLNQAEMRSLGWQLEEHGIELVYSYKDSDLIVLNTCTVTAPAAADSRARIRTVRKKNPAARVITTGCWATMEPASAAELAGPGNVIPNDQKDTILAIILEEAGIPPKQSASPTRKPRFRRTRAFIKVQDGCSSRCSYCITTIARGPAESVPVADIIHSIQREIDYGAKEVVLTGVQLNQYGADLENTDLAALIDSILHHTAIPRLRLSSVEPWNLPEGFFKLWASPRLCRHFHLPLQSGCSATLRRMRRPYSPEQYRKLVENTLDVVPAAAISTDIITGFPGESEEEFQESLQFIEKLDFAHGHVFSYSPRPSTDAAQLPGRITERIIKDRTRWIRAVFEKKKQAFRKKALNKLVDVLWEKAEQGIDGKWTLYGFSDNYLRVHCVSDRDLRNTISQVRLVRCGKNSMEGELQN